MSLPKVLVVDDDDDMTALLAMSLHGAWDVQTAATPEEALASLARQTPDVILLDLHLGGVRGTDVLRDIRTRKPAVGATVLFLTAETSAEVQAELIGLGAAGVLRKPVNPLTLAAELKTYLPERPDA
jgi:two-component system, OmpR family, response regulator